jgi:hypothetical protein
VLLETAVSHPYPWGYRACRVGFTYVMVTWCRSTSPLLSTNSLLRHMQACALLPTPAKSYLLPRSVNMTDDAYAVSLRTPCSCPWSMSASQQKNDWQLVANEFIKDIHGGVDCSQSFQNCSPSSMSVFVDGYQGRNALRCGVRCHPS